jgi:hypothetical protein
MEADANQKFLCLKRLSHFGNRAWLTSREVAFVLISQVSSLNSVHS